MSKRWEGWVRVVSVIHQYVLCDLGIGEGIVVQIALWSVQEKGVITEEMISGITPVVRKMWSMQEKHLCG